MKMTIAVTVVINKHVVLSTVSLVGMTMEVRVRTRNLLDLCFEFFLIQKMMRLVLDSKKLVSNTRVTRVAVLSVEDGNRGVQNSQQVPLTDFSLSYQAQYAYWVVVHLVMLLPIEY
jgi:hypothetical protein